MKMMGIISLICGLATLYLGVGAFVGYLNGAQMGIVIAVVALIMALYAFAVSFAFFKKLL